MKRITPIILLLALILNGCGVVKVTNTPAANAAPVASLIPLGTPTVQYGTEVARPLIRDFSNIGPRTPGSEGEAKTAEYIESVFKAIGYVPESQPFTANAGNQTINSTNVIALKQGNSTQEIIVGAHYDASGEGSGADDNASGVAVMLETAKLVQNIQTPYSIRFIAFGAEEAGLLGSYAHLNQMSQQEFENAVAMIDLDSLIAGDTAYVLSDEGVQSFVCDWALEWALGNGFTLQTIQNLDLTDPATKKGYSDYSAFRDAGIPFAYFTSGNFGQGNQPSQAQVDVRYGDQGIIRHTKYDTLAYLDATFPGRVDQRLNLFISVLYNLLTQFEVPVR
jgi:alkaline phosphatase isozyme conversion protein